VGHSDGRGLRRARPLGMLLDFRWLDGLEPAFFQKAAAWTLANRHALSRSLTRLALVRPTGVGGAIVAGFFDVVEPFCAFEVFTSPDVALDWLGIGDASVLGQVEALRADAFTTTPPLSTSSKRCSTVTPRRASPGRHETSD